MKKILLYLFVFLSCSAYGQISGLSSISNLKNMDPEMMTDAQVEQVLTKMQTEGYSTTQFDQYAEKQGLDKTTTAKFKNRIVRYNTDVNGLKKRKKMDPEELKKFGLTPETEEEIDPRLMKYFEAYMQKQDSIKELELPVFGASMFQELNMSFETNLRMATPESYILGPDDEVVLDIYGLSEGHFNLQVSPEGTIRIPNVGIVNVGGLSVVEAKQSIKKSLVPYYAGMNSGETKLSIALGDIRSITVNVIGEVKYPGTYTIPSLATVYNALYQSGGPAENGSFRMVNIIRGGKVIETVDLYDFLVFGKETNVRLQDQDAIKVLPYRNRVSISGEVKSKALFEVKENETLADLIKFAGGFTEKAFQERITAYRNTTKEKSVIDVSAPDFGSFIVKAGDAYKVGEILERFSNRVQIQGSVYRPGEYALTEGMKASDLLHKAEGLLEDAFATRAIVFRKDANNLPEITSFSPVDALNGKNDLLLRREDSVQIYSTIDMKEEEYIYVAGEVVKPDKYVFSKGMTLKDAILIAQGITTKADKGEVEVFRQETDPAVLLNNLLKAKSFKFKLDQVLAFGDEASEFKLQKEDRIIIRSMFGYEDMKQIKVEGEVMRKGTYVITSKNQRVSDVI
ncbi:MAG: SLBB domain-containing protein, partial [Bacteroidales bacterium]|nr:SLBB domain-containing protein [Bacteroidales bacterium]